MTTTEFKHFIDCIGRITIPILFLFLIFTTGNWFIALGASIICAIPIAIISVTTDRIIR